MKFSPTEIPGCYVIEYHPVVDERGFLARVFCRQDFVAAGIDFQVAQVNFSRTLKKGTIRGLHYQTTPNTENKIVRVDQGSVFDVCVDLRVESPTYGQCISEILTSENNKMMLIPKGCAHGFQTLEDDCAMTYTHDACYSQTADVAVHYADPVLNIQWPLPVTVISGRDRNAPSLVLPATKNMKT